MYKRSEHVTAVMDRLKHRASDKRGFVDEATDVNLKDKIWQLLQTDNTGCDRDRLEQYLNVNRRFTICEANSIASIIAANWKLRKTRRNDQNSNNQAKRDHARR